MTEPPAAALSFRPIVFLSGAAFASSATLRVSDALLPQLSAEFGVPVGSASGVATAFAVSYGLFQLFYGFLGDRFGKYHIVTLATALSALVASAGAFAHSLGVLEVLRFCNGFTAAAIIPLSLAHIGDIVPYEARQPVIARFASGQILGVIAGQLFGGLFGEHLGWRGIFLALGLLYLVIAILLALEGRSSRAIAHRVVPGAARGSLVADFLTLLRIPRTRVVLAAVSAEGFLFFGAFAYVGAYLRDIFGMSYDEMGGFLASFGLGGLAYALTARRVVNRLGQRGMVLLGAIGLAATYGLLAIEPPTLTLVPLIALLGTAFYLLHNTLQTNATQMAPHARGLAVSTFASCLFLGQAGGVALAGWCIDRVGYRPVFAAAGGLLLVTALLFRARLAPPARGSRTTTP